MFARTGANTEKICKVVELVMNKRGSWGLFNREFLSGVAQDLQHEIEKVWGPGTVEEWRLLRELEAQSRELLIYVWENQRGKMKPEIPDVYVRQINTAKTALDRHRKVVQDEALPSV